MKAATMKINKAGIANDCFFILPLRHIDTSTHPTDSFGTTPDDRPRHGGTRSGARSGRGGGARYVVAWYGAVGMGLVDRRMMIAGLADHPTYVSMHTICPRTSAAASSGAPPADGAGLEAVRAELAALRGTWSVCLVHVERLGDGLGRTT